MPNLYIVFFDKAAAEILSNTWEKYLGYSSSQKLLTIRWSNGYEFIFFFTVQWFFDSTGLHVNFLALLSHLQKLYPFTPVQNYFSSFFFLFNFFLIFTVANQQPNVFWNPLNKYFLYTWFLYYVCFMHLQFY